MSLPQRLAFSGLLKSGKDYVAEKIGYKTISFAEPLYALCAYFFGVCDKNNPDHRKFLQYVGQIGWGARHWKNYPDTIERATLTGFLRREGHSIYPHRDWGSFGIRKDFWVTDLLDRLYNRHNNDNVVVTNVRFEHEIVPMRDAGFQHYLVLCSEETRRERYGGRIPPEIDNDKSEEFARELVNTIADEHVIWNDTREPVPARKNYLTVEQFCGL